MGRYSTNYDGCGIYALFNVIDAKIYIGQSKNIKRRFEHHKASFAAKSKVNPMYQEPIGKFAFFILCKTDAETFSKFNLILEELYIDQAMRYDLEIYNILKHKPGDSFVSHLNYIFSVEKNMESAFVNSFGRRAFRMHLTSLSSRQKDLEEFAG